MACSFTEKAKGVYRARKPTSSPLWQCINNHFDDFLLAYSNKYEQKLGFLRPVIPRVINKFLDCGDLVHGFARVRCKQCGHEYLLAFSCKGRWFCPACHEKKVLLFGEFVIGSVTFPVPHRHYVFTIPKILRPYFRYHRELLKELCAVAQNCLIEFMRTMLDIPDGCPGVIMAIHTFGDYADFHPHLHALVADGLFTKSGMFYVLPEGGMKALEELFRNRVIAMLVKKQLLPVERARMLLNWVHSGFNVHHSRRIWPKEQKDLESIAQYIIRNPFAEDKMTVDSSTGLVTYHSKKNIKHKRDYEVFSSIDFIAQITQHIPDTGAQMVRYYGYYSNKSRGMRAKLAREGGVQISLQSADSCLQPDIVDISDYQPRRTASKKWRELIKKVWEVDPLICPQCQGEMKMIALIDDAEVISRILKHLGLWPEFHPVRQPAERERGPPVAETCAVGFRDPMPNYDVEPVMVTREDRVEDLPDPMPNYDIEEVVFTE